MTDSSPHDQPEISVIIPTHNRPDKIGDCLRALVAQIAADAPVELVVCDDSRNFQTRDLVASRFPQVRWSEGPKTGPAGNRNAGARVARGTWLVFVDDDSVPRPDFLAAYRAEFQKWNPDDLVLMQGAIESDAKKCSLLWEAPYKRTGGGPLISCNFAMSRRVFLAAGGFDERYPNFEDTEFSERFSKRAGARVIFAGTAIVDHPLRQLPSPRRMAQRWEARAISSYDFGATTAQLAWRLPKHIGLVILSRLRGHRLKRENRKAAAIYFGEFLMVLWLLPGWLRKHHSALRSAFWKEQIQAGTVPPRYGL